MPRSRGTLLRSMENESQDQQISGKAFKELKEIALSEFGNGMTDDEIREMGMRLLRFTALITSGSEQQPAKIQINKQEFKVLKFLHHEIHHNKKSPSVREIAAVLGLNSSRSGVKFLNALIERGLVYRNEAGNLELTDKGECEPEVEIKKK